MAGGDADVSLVPKQEISTAPELTLRSMDTFDFSWDGTHVVIQECWDLHVVGAWHHLETTYVSHHRVNSAVSQGGTM